jgi:ABC-type transporter Mla subunit MlaD
MALQDLMTALNQQIKEHNDARTTLDTATTALEDMRKALAGKMSELDVDASKEKAESEDVRAALQAIRDEVDRQLSQLPPPTTTTQATTTTTGAVPAGPAAGKSTRLK